MPNMRQLLAQENGNVIYCSTPYEAARGAHALLLLTEWEEFRSLDWERIRREMEVPVLVDGRNLLDPGQMQEAGFEHCSVGRTEPLFGDVSMQESRAKRSFSPRSEATDNMGTASREAVLPVARSFSPRSVVTGGAGFLGSHLCERLLAEGHEVICIDNLITGSCENIQHLQDHPRFAFLRHELTESTDLAALVHSNGKGSASSDERVDYVLHLASLASPKDYLRYPIQTLQTGATGTYHALNLAKALGSVFLLASSSEVYGDPEVNPQPESYWGCVNPIGPRSVYDEAKRFAEALTMAYAREYGVRVRIARIFNTYGERMRVGDGRVLPNFLTQALQNSPLTVYGDGRQTRSLCHVSDLMEGLYRLLISDETGPLNLGNPEEVSVLQLAHEILELTASKSTIVFESLPIDDPQKRCPDICKALKVLGWQPQISRQEGINRSIPYFKGQLEVQCTA